MIRYQNLNKNTFETALELANLFRGHPELLYLKGVVDDLMDLESCGSDLGSLPHLRQAITLAHQINANVSDWTMVLPHLQNYPQPHYNQKGQAINPFNGKGLSDYSIWPILITKHPNTHINIEFRKFLAESINYLIEYVNKFSTLKNYLDWVDQKNKDHPLRLYNSTALSVSVSIRYLIQAEYKDDLLLFLSDYKAHGLSKSLALALNNSSLTKSFKGRLTHISRMLDYLTDRKPPCRSRRDVRSRKNKNIGIDGCDSTEFIIKPNEFTDEEDAQIETLGSYLLTIDSDDAEDISDSDNSATIAEKNRWSDPSYQVQYIARANIVLPHSRNHLQSYQLELIDQWIRNTSICLARRRLIAGMLLLGRSYHAVLAAKFSLSHIPQAHDVDIEFLVDIGCWRIRPISPDVTQREGLHYLPIATALSLPLLPEWRDALFPDKTTAIVGKHLTENHNLSEQELRNLLHQIASSLRPSLITQWLGKTLFLTTHSHNAAALITPYGAPHLTTLTHYEHPRISTLATAYAHVLQNLQHLLTLTPSPIISPLQQNDDARTGTPTASDPDHLAAWIAQAINKLNTLDINQIDQFCDYSNEFVRYSLLLLNANCLLRGITNPHIEVYDLHKKNVVIADKDRGSHGAMSRLIPLTKVGFSQLEHMQKHRQALRIRTGMPSAIDTLNWPILTWNNKNAGSRHPIQIDAATTQHIVATDFPGHLNAFRKLLHTRLGEEGIPGQYLDALCGHWHPGMEAYSQYSALHPRLLIATVLPVLTNLMNELGFQSIKSRIK